MQCQRLLEIQFGEGIPYVGENNTRLTIHVDHINTYITIWNTIPNREWVYMFIHTLDMIPKNRYTSLDIRQGTTEWDDLAKSYGEIPIPVSCFP